jgi:hypothetical protein
MRELSDKLAGVVKSAEARLVQVSEAEGSKPALSGGWSRKQVLGHLIDSASNNHQRFVRAGCAGFAGFSGLRPGRFRARASGRKSKLDSTRFPVDGLQRLSRSCHRSLASVQARDPLSHWLGRTCDAKIPGGGLFAASLGPSPPNRRRPVVKRGVAEVSETDGPPRLRVS